MVQQQLDQLGLDLNPQTITIQTFKALLSKYETTVHNKTRRKALTKATPKSKTKARTGTAKRKGKQEKKQDVSGGIPEQSEKEEEEEEQEKESNSSRDLDQENAITDAVQQFKELDNWRYDTLPGLLQKRQEDEEKSCYLSREEVVRLMEWKLKHGVNRPMLLGMIRANTEQTVRSATGAAFSSPPSPPLQGNDKDPEDGFSALQASLEKLTAPLRGVGPATASLFLSVYAPKETPFYSDDVFLWLVVGVYPPPPPPPSSSSLSRSVSEETERKGSKEVKPNGELNVKYNIPEYRRLWEAVRVLRERLNKKIDDEAEEVSCADVEKVALVVRHLDLSELGYGERADEHGDGRDEGEGETKRRRVR
ncbi:hypothetical protein BDV18DRAFT_157465 [Aspergillus unguis]